MRWSDIPFSPPDAMLRQFAGLWLVAFGGLAAWNVLRHDRPGLAIGLGVAAVAVGGLGLIRPRTIRPLFVGWMVLAFPIGWAVSNVLMGVVYFGLFLPIALIFRLNGRDALRLRPHPDEKTYWQVRSAPIDPRRYFRQF